MQAKTKNKIGELQLIISKMPLQLTFVNVLPEFGIHWRDLFQAIRNARLPMTPTSVARVIGSEVSKLWTPDEISDIVAKLRLKLITTQRRKWHVIKLVEPVSFEAINMMSNMLPKRIQQSLGMLKSNLKIRPEVQTVKLGDLIYISIVKENGLLYVATPPGIPVALVSSLRSSLLTACVRALGYNNYEDACLNGSNVGSLLQIYNSNYTEHVDELTATPEYAVAPCLSRNGIDFTGRQFDENFVQKALGPNPPQLSTLDITLYKTFFDPQILNKKIKVHIQLKSEDVVKSLKTWVTKGGLLPTSELFTTFHKIKSNKICINSDHE